MCIYVVFFHSWSCVKVFEREFKSLDIYSETAILYEKQCLLTE